MKSKFSVVLAALALLMLLAMDMHGQSLQPHGTIAGTVVDTDGAFVAGATVKVFASDVVTNWTATTALDGSFHFTAIPPGAYSLRITVNGFAEGAIGQFRLADGENHDIAPIVLRVAPSTTDVQVGVSQQEVAQEEVKAEERQRLVGIIPNFHVSYVWNAPPLTAKQKFELAWRESVDPYSFVVTGMAAAVEQARDTTPGFGKGVAGYSKRYAASYGNLFNSEMIGAAVLPSLLHQDPRYFVKGQGSIATRTLYALGSPLFTRSDGGRWQPNVSAIGGTFAAAEIANLYYPQGSGNQINLGNVLLAYGEEAGSRLLEELFSSKITPSTDKSLPVETNIILRDGTPVPLAFAEEVAPGSAGPIKLVLTKDLKVDGVVAVRAGSIAHAQFLQPADSSQPCLRIQYLQDGATPIHLRWGKNAEGPCLNLDSSIPAGRAALAYVDGSISLHPAQEGDSKH